MTRSSSIFSALELKQLLIEILEHAPHTCVRFRLLGEMWQTNMVRVVGFSESKVFVNDEIKNALLPIELNSIIQFEIDNKYKGFQPYFHYEVTLDSKFNKKIN